MSSLIPSMDNKRIFVWGAFALALWLNFVAWQKDYPPVAATVSAPAVAAPTAGTEPASELPALPDEAVKPKEATPAVASTTSVDAEGGNTATASASKIHVKTDVLDLEISTRGGELLQADLPKYPKVKNDPSVPVRLLDSSDGADLFVARSGLRAAGTGPQPSHQALFNADSTDYQLQPGQDTLPVKLSWSDGQGITVVKTYTLHRNSYTIDLTYDVTNSSDKDWKAASYLQLLRHYTAVKRSMFNTETYAYRGPAIYDGKKSVKPNVQDAEERNYKNTFAGGWMAALQHHFVVAAIPPGSDQYDYQLAVDPQNDYVLTYRSPLKDVAAGGHAQFSERLFIGPKLQNQLKDIAPGLEKAVDYGRLTIFAQPLFWLLSKVHGIVGNWGLAIIIVTFLIKLVFYKLTETSGRSMAKMRKLTPRIKALQERYKDEREKLGRAMMDLYKAEKINPLAGCLPILIQIPVFMGFYWVLLESVEMRQAPFFGWISDLSSRDPVFILPALMGVAMFGQFKMNPNPGMDPTQAKVFAFMPLVMTGMMAWFPAGLVLYWITNTVLSVAQQWNINRVVGMGAASAGGGGEKT